MYQVQLLQSKENSVFKNKAARGKMSEFSSLSSPLRIRGKLYMILRQLAMQVKSVLKKTRSSEKYEGSSRTITGEGVRP
jgi:hypothetical protein